MSAPSSPSASGTKAARPVTVPTRDLLARQIVEVSGCSSPAPDIGDIAGMLVGALETARQTRQWELLRDALRFVHDRLEARHVADVSLNDVTTALGETYRQSLTADEAAHLDEVIAQGVDEATDPHRRHIAPDTLGGAYLDHLLRGDGVGAVELMRRAVTHGMHSSEVLLDILEPVQREVGRRWAIGSISIVQEHFCTAITQFVMTDLYSGMISGETETRRLVAVHAPGSLHRVGLRMVADVLECRGWDTTYVGLETTIETLVELLVENDAHLLLVSASMPSQIPHLTTLIGAIRNDSRTRDVKVVVGGRPFLVAPELVDEVGADGWARDARDAVDVCNNLTGGDDDQR